MFDKAGERPAELPRRGGRRLSAWYRGHSQDLRDARRHGLDRESGGRSATRSEDHAILNFLDGSRGRGALLAILFA